MRKKDSMTKRVEREARSLRHFYPGGVIQLVECRLVNFFGKGFLGNRVVYAFWNVGSAAA